MGPDVFNKETGILSVYRVDFFMGVPLGRLLLRCAKGDRDCRIMRLIFYLNYQKRTSWGTASSMLLGAKFTSALGHQADVNAGVPGLAAWADDRTYATASLSAPSP
jgi:hypothetical protein